MDSERYNLNVQTTELKFDLLQFYPWVRSFVFAVLFELSFDVLSGYFHASLNLVTISHCLNLLKFRDTAPLITGLLRLASDEVYWKTSEQRARKVGKYYLRQISIQLIKISRICP